MYVCSSLIKLVVAMELHKYIDFACIGTLVRDAIRYSVRSLLQR